MAATIFTCAKTRPSNAMKYQNDKKIIFLKKTNFLLTIVITVLLIILQAFGESPAALLRYENTISQTGEWWRLLSGHFIHLGWMHLSMNLAALWILAFLFERVEKPLTSLISIFILALGISLGLLNFSPNIEWYVGFSGVLHGLIVLGALASFRNEPRTAALLLVGISAKLLWEQFFADAHAMESTIGGMVVYDAHLYGAITGILIAAILKIISLSRGNTEEQIG